MDTAGVERVDFNSLGGADLVTVDDLTGTDVKNVNVDLGGADAQADHVVVNGTNGADRIRVNQAAAGLTVNGLSAQVAINNQEPTDALLVKGLDGNDDIAAAGLPAQAIALTLDGGSGDDELFGGLGNDMRAPKSAAVNASVTAAESSRVYSLRAVQASWSTLPNSTSCGPAVNTTWNGASNTTRPVSWMTTPRPGSVTRKLRPVTVRVPSTRSYVSTRFPVKRMR